jgi:hypothetical protein
MNKRFASFLFAGKIATVPLFAQESLGAVEDIYTKTISKASVHDSMLSKSLEMKKLKPIELDKNSCNSHNINTPCVQDIMNLVINGLHEKDEILVAMSSEKDPVNLLNNDPLLLAKSHKTDIWNHFSVISSSSNYEKSPKDKNLSLKQAVKPISLPVDLSLMSQQFQNVQHEKKVYLQVLVASNSQWDKSVFRYSEPLAVNTEKSNTIITSQYGDDSEECPAYTTY